MEVQKFIHPVFNEIRIGQAEGKEWFCLSDVCKALEINNVGNVKSRLSKRGIRSMDTPTYNQHGTMVMQPMTYIDEPNLYRCIFQSRKQEAEKFQNWVTSEVLPQIRRTGGYIPVKAEDDEKTIMAKAMQILKKTLDVQEQSLESQHLELTSSSLFG